MLSENPPRDPNKQTPARFVEQEQGAAESEDVRSLAQTTWNELFESEGLRELIAVALKNNQELNIQLQEMVAAQSEVSARQGEVLPKVSAGVEVGIDKDGKYTSKGVSDDSNGVAEHLPNFSFGLRGSWEIDVWRKLRNAVKVADLHYLASIEARNFMVTQIVAELAKSYYEILALDSQLEVLNKNIAIQKDALKIVRLEKEAARVTELAVQRFEAEVLKNQGRRFALEQERVLTENRINFLAGRFPQAVPRRLEEFQRAAPDTVQTGLPSELLKNRPDVRRAELELEAAKLDVEVAKAGFFPSLSIEAGVGYNAFNASHLLATPESLFYNIAGNLVAPLLNRAAITAQYRTANARQVQAVFDYEKTILQAFTDVANHLSALKNLRQVYSLQSQQVETLERSVSVSNVLFQSARADYMEVLLTRRDSLDAQMELIETKRQQFEAVINVYQALGGGWQRSPSDAPAASPEAASGGHRVKPR